MKLIYKYSLDAYGPSGQSIELPVGAKVLSAEVQRTTSSGGVREYLHVWALVDSGVTVSETHRFKVCTTGDPNGVPDVWRAFLGTHLFEEGTYVVHVFYLGVGPIPV